MKATCLRNPFREWLTPAMWVNILALSLDMDLFADLPDLMRKNEVANEKEAVPDTFRLWITCEAHPSFPSRCCR